MFSPILWVVFTFMMMSFETQKFKNFFLGPHLGHMEVPRLGVELELQPLVYTTATATQDPSLVCDLYHRSRQRHILNLLSKAGDRTLNLMVRSWDSFPLCHDGNSKPGFYSWYFFRQLLQSELLFIFSIFKRFIIVDLQCCNNSYSFKDCVCFCCFCLSLGIFLQ